MSRKLEVALTEYLGADTRLQGLVQDVGGQFRMYPAQVPQGAKMPCITWRRVSATREYTYDPFEETDAWVNARVQFICYAASPLEAIDVGEAVMLALSGYEGEMSGQYIGSSVGVQEFDDVERGRTFRRVMDFVISYEDDLADVS